MKMKKIFKNNNSTADLLYHATISRLYRAWT